MRMHGKYITRLTHNNNNWTKPSCKDGKCITITQNKLYEEIAGFGWEEWLFSPYNRVVENGKIYQYGYLQCFNKTPSNEEKIYEEVFLYTRKCHIKKPKDGEYHLVAKIKNLIQLSQKELDKINTQFQQNGNFDRMRNDNCVNEEYFNTGPIPNGYRINAKFKVTDVKIDDAQTEIEIKYYRFKIIKLNHEIVWHNELINLLDNINTFNNLE